MRVSEFRMAVAEEFGDSYGPVLLRDLVLSSLGDRTAEQALTSGIPPRDVWLALCEANNVPVPRRHGRGRPDPKR